MRDGLLDFCATFRTVSGNWFEHFERFVQQALYIRGFVLPALSTDKSLGLGVKTCNKVPRVEAALKLQNGAFLEALFMSGRAAFWRRIWQIINKLGEADTPFHHKYVACVSDL